MSKQYLDQLLEQFIHMPEGPVGAALQVTQHGKTIYEKYVGKADLASGRPIDENTLYRLYSCSKIFTASSLMLLLERGIVQLDDPVSEFLPEYKDAVYCVYSGNNLESYRPVESLTLRHLVTMTSGLTYGGQFSTTHREVAAAMDELEQSGDYSTRDFARRMAKVPLAFAPGSHWNYGVGHDVLAAAIEVIAGKRFGRFLHDEFFQPLGMENTFFHIPAEKADRLCTMYRYENGQRLENHDGDDGFLKPGSYESGGGGLVSTLSDMARFGTMLCLGGTVDGVRVLGRKTIDLMRQNQLGEGALKDFYAAHKNGWPFMSGYGYGLGVKTLLDQPLSGCMGSMGEFSWAGAAGTLLSMDPAEGTCITYMHQVMPRNQEGYCHPRIKNAVNGLLL